MVTSSFLISPTKNLTIQEVKLLDQSTFTLSNSLVLRMTKEAGSQVHVHFCLVSPLCCPVLTFPSTEDMIATFKKMCQEMDDPESRTEPTLSARQPNITKGLR